MVEVGQGRVIAQINFTQLGGGCHQLVAVFLVVLLRAVEQMLDFLHPLDQFTIALLDRGVFPGHFLQRLGTDPALG